MSLIAVSFRSASTMLQKIAAAWAAALMMLSAGPNSLASPSSTVGRPPGVVGNHIRAVFIEDWMWAVLAVALVAAALYVLRNYSRKGSASRLRRFVAVVTGVALLLVVVWAFIVPSAAAGPWVPNLDLVTVTLFAVAIVGALAQLILDTREEDVILTLSNQNEAMREQRAIVVATGASLIAETASLMDRWAHALNDYVAASTMPDVNLQPRGDGFPFILTARDLYPLWQNFMFSHLIEARGWLGPSDEPRIAVWVADQHDVLSIAGCTDVVSDALGRAKFKAHEGIAGRAFAERKLFNIVDPARHADFKDLDGEPYPYKSMLVVPICYGPRRTLGVLCIDRMCESECDANVVKVMSALAKHLGIALALAEARKRELG